jgi:hypothetical protein
MIALVHAIYPAMAPLEASFQRLWPEAPRFNLVDDGLTVALEREGNLTESIHARIGRLAEHGWRAGAQCVLFSCSAFGAAIERAAQAAPVPVLKPNEAMFLQALQAGGRIGMLATFAPAVDSMEQEFRALSAARGGAAAIETICVPEAMAAARGGDVARHDALVAHAAPRLAHCDAVMLAHFSTSTAKPAVEQVLGRAVLTAPDAAVQRVMHLLQARPQGGSA